jgi:hypothetical protein
MLPLCRQNVAEAMYPSVVTHHRRRNKNLSRIGAASADIGVPPECANGSWTPSPSGRIAVTLNEIPRSNCTRRFP